MSQPLMESLLSDPNLWDLGRTRTQAEVIEHFENLGYGYTTIRNAYNAAKFFNFVNPSSPSSGDQENTSIEDDEKDNIKSLASKSNRIKTVEQLLARAEVDMSIWEIDRKVVNSWEIGAKDDNGSIVVEPLFQIKVWLKKRVEIVSVRDELSQMVDDAKSFMPIYPAIKYSKIEDPHLLEISPFDLHLGKLCWGEETGGADYDSHIARDLLLDAVQSLMSRAQGFSVDRILFPLGNDFFNTDNIENGTTKGTRQDVDSRWQKMVVLGRRLAVEAIDMMSQIAPVDVVMISGNHDTERVFSLGESLHCWYRSCPNVTIDNEPKLRKAYIYGKCLIGLTHGDKEPEREMPLLMATEYPELWGATVWREIHKAHFHKKSELRSRNVDEHHGVRVCTLPSLSASDSWHSGRGYNSLRSAEAFVWHADQGRIANYSYNVSDSPLIK